MAKPKFRFGHFRSLVKISKIFFFFKLMIVLKYAFHSYQSNCITIVWLFSYASLHFYFADGNRIVRY